MEARRDRPASCRLPGSRLESTDLEARPPASLTLSAFLTLGELLNPSFSPSVSGVSESNYFRELL